MEQITKYYVVIEGVDYKNISFVQSLHVYHNHPVREMEFDSFSDADNFARTMTTREALAHIERYNNHFGIKICKPKVVSVMVTSNTLTNGSHLVAIEQEYKR